MSDRYRPDVCRLVAEVGGGASAAELRSAGASRRTIAAAVSVGELIEVRRGGFVLPTASADLAAAVRYSSSLTCVSALARLGYQLVSRPSQPHLAAARYRDRPGVVWHRSTRGPLIDDQLPAVCQALRCLPAAGALAVADQALGRGIDIGDLRDRLRLRGRGTATWVLEHADARAESALESAVRAALLGGGITDIELQVELPDIGRVDMVVEGWLIIEADGREDHVGKEPFRKDRRRVVASMRSGHLTLPFTWGDAVDEPDCVVDAVREVLSRHRDGHFRTKVTIGGTHARPFPQVTAMGPPARI